jgi:hypothetical protein
MKVVESRECELEAEEVGRGKEWRGSVGGKASENGNKEEGKEGAGGVVVVDPTIEEIR